MYHTLLAPPASAPVREWNTGFTYKKIAPMLSQSTVGADGITTPSSVSILQIQFNSAAIFVTAIRIIVPFLFIS